MRNVVATLYVSALFQGGKGGANTGFYVGYRVIPTGLAGYLQCRTTYVWALFGKILNGFPYLLYLADAQFGLVEQNEVLI